MADKDAITEPQGKPHNQNKLYTYDVDFDSELHEVTSEWLNFGAVFINGYPRMYY